MKAECNKEVKTVNDSGKSACVNVCSFLSCLITGVLTHHLSWASTVAPVGDAPASTYLDKHVAKWVSRSSVVPALIFLGYILVSDQYFYLMCEILVQEKTCTRKHNTQ